MSGGMRILFYILSILIPIGGFVIGAILLMDSRQENKRVGKICLALGVVSILMVVSLAAAIYIFVLGFGETIYDGPTASLTRATVDYGCRITIVSLTGTVSWDDVSILLSDGYEFCEWHPTYSELSDGSQVTLSLPGMLLGSTLVYCEVTDLLGNGFLNSMDLFTLRTSSSTPFSAATTYEVTLIFEPSSESIARITFNG